MPRRLLKMAAIHGFAAVAVGAFAAHALKSRLEPEALGWVETGARYQMYHGLALLGLAALADKFGEDRLKWAGLGFFWGALIFSSSLYALALGGPRWLGALTPLGGLGMLGGWLILFLAFRS